VYGYFALRISPHVGNQELVAKFGSVDASFRENISVFNPSPYKYSDLSKGATLKESSRDSQGFPILERVRPYETSVSFPAAGDRPPVHDPIGEIKIRRWISFKMTPIGPGDPILGRRSSTILPHGENNEIIIDDACLKVPHENKSSLNGSETFCSEAIGSIEKISLDNRYSREEPGKNCEYKCIERNGVSGCPVPKFFQWGILIVFCLSFIVTIGIASVCWRNGYG